MTDTLSHEVILTDTARDRVKALFEAQGLEDVRLRIEVKPGGCQGMNYDLFFDDKADEVDEIFPFGDFETVVDPGSLALINGATIDYEDTLTKQGLVIENPNATSTCACGESFC